MDPGGGNVTDQPASAEFPQGWTVSGRGEDRLRAGAELLFLPGSVGRVSHRGVSGGGWVFQVQLLLLYHRFPHFAGSSAGTLHLRLPVSLRLVSGVTAQDPHKEALHEEAEAAAIPQVRRSAGDGLPAAGVSCERRGHGRPVLLQIPLSPRRAGGSHPAVPRQFRHPGGAGQAVYMEVQHPAIGDRAERTVLPPLLQVALSAGRALRAVQPGVPLPDEGGQE